MTFPSSLFSAMSNLQRRCGIKPGNKHIFPLRVEGFDFYLIFSNRICQFRLMKKMPDVQLEAVEFLSAPDRGGIGSTGEK